MVPQPSDDGGAVRNGAWHHSPRGGLVVDATVSSRKTSFVIYPTLLIGMPATHAVRLARRRELARWRQGFYKHELLFVELMPQCWHLDRNPVCCQSCTQLLDRQISCFLQPSPQYRLHPDQWDRRWPPIGRLHAVLSI